MDVETVQQQLAEQQAINQEFYNRLLQTQAQAEANQQNQNEQTNGQNDPTEATTNDNENQIRTVNMKPPTFHPDDPTLFCTKLELMFALHRIAGDTAKFRYAAASMDHKKASAANDIKNLPATKKYETERTDNKCFVRIFRNQIEQTSTTTRTRLRQTITISTSIEKLS